MTLTVVGTDGNGAPLTVTVPVSTPFTIDSAAPVATETLSTSRRVGKLGGPINDPVQPYVAKNGDTLSFGGFVYASAGSTQLETTPAQDRPASPGSTPPPTTMHPPTPPDTPRHPPTPRASAKLT